MVTDRTELTQRRCCPRRGFAPSMTAAGLSEGKARGLCVLSVLPPAQNCSGVGEEHLHGGHSCFASGVVEKRRKSSVV